MIRPTIVLVLTALATSAFSAEPVIRRDIPYAGTADSYTPAAPFIGKSRNHPVVIWIHGGGWATGDKADPTDTVERKARACVDHGCILISVNYRLFFAPKDHPGATRPAVNLHDIGADLAKAIRWAHENAAAAGGNPDFIFVVGHSAGAQLAALISTDESYLKAEGLPLTLIKGCVPVDGDSFYPTLQIDMAVTPQRAEGYRNIPDGRDQKDLSSVMHVAPGKGIPPFLIIHVADFPETGTRLQSEILCQRLCDAGIPARTFAAAGKNHLTLDADLGKESDPATQAMFEFFDAQIWRINYESWSRSANVPMASEPSTLSRRP